MGFPGFVFSLLMSSAFFGDTANDSVYSRGENWTMELMSKRRMVYENESKKWGSRFEAIEVRAGLWFDNPIMRCQAINAQRWRITTLPDMTAFLIFAASLFGLVAEKLVILKYYSWKQSFRLWCSCAHHTLKTRRRRLLLRSSRECLLFTKRPLNNSSTCVEQTSKSRQSMAR